MRNGNILMNTMNAMWITLHVHSMHARQQSLKRGACICVWIVYLYSYSYFYLWVWYVCMATVLQNLQKYALKMCHFNHESIWNTNRVHFADGILMILFYMNEYHLHICDAAHLVPLRPVFSLFLDCPFFCTL